MHGVLAQMLGVYLELGSTLNTRSPMFATKTKLPSVSRGRLAVRALNAVAIIVPILVIACESQRLGQGRSELTQICDLVSSFGARLRPRECL